MKTKKPIIALMYDFDKTLCPKDMQEYGFIPSVHESAESFWEDATNLAKQEKMDAILTYMYLMIKKSKATDQSLRRETFVALGKNIELFLGVEDWFDRITKFGEDYGITIEHYIISSGLKEIIEGSPISKKFKEIYACEFHYDASGAADWPKQAVNYTNKTQFLFRVNKGILDISKSSELNKYVPNDERRIPFRNMIYIGDGLTDVPCMKLVKINGGQSIAVYQKGKKNKVHELIQDGRVDFITLADYSAESEIDEIVKKIIVKMAGSSELAALHRKQIKSLIK